MKMRYVVALVCLLSAGTLLAQAPQEKIDSTAISRIRDEGMNRSQVMDIISYLSDVYGPRLTGSPGFDRAAAWAEKTLSSWGIENVHQENWGPFGRSWSLKHYAANVLGPQVFPLISYPKAWSPAVSGTMDIVYFDAKTDSEVELYTGKLHGKAVLFEELRDIKAHFEPEATRDADSTLLKLANAAGTMFRGRRGMFGAEDRARTLVNFHKWQLCQKEGAAVILTEGRMGDGGNIFVQQVSIPQHPDSSMQRRVNPWQAEAPKIIPQIAVGAEHYNRLVRMIRKGEHPRLDVELEVAVNRADSTFNIIGEIPGSDLKDEIVMIGGHFDSWHGGTGATDNGTGSAVCMEAMRILKTLGLHPRRTIRIGLWSGEEQGLLGSAAYVKQHFGERSGSMFDSTSKITLKPEAENFSVYFNHDNGSGKIRGVYMQGNEATRPIFRAWLAPFADLGASTLTPNNTGGTDHGSFDAIGLPGFQFIQDPLEYETRTHHSTMDVYDRVQQDDLKQGAVIMASFAYDAAMRDGKFPRKPAPRPRPVQGPGQ
ncbi:MAG TPA: M28 family peptidase [Bacteroidota bacterium]|nr:M28 family peptidase [Bacteroidota bacterium]